jgi:hypothetical protein
LSLADLSSHVQTHRPPVVEPAPPSQPPSRAATDTAEAQPTMALKSDPEPDVKGTTAAASPPKPTVLLNPGNAKPQNMTGEKDLGTQAARRPVDNGTADPAASDPNRGNVTSDNHPPDAASASAKERAGTRKRTQWQRTLDKNRSALRRKQSAPRADAPSVSHGR